MILVGGSNRGQGGVVAKSAVVHSGWYIINLSEFKMSSYGRACSFLRPLVGYSDAFVDFHCLSSYPLDQVGSGNFLGGRFMIGWKKVFRSCELIFCILIRKFCTEPLVQRYILFIVSAAVVWLTSGRMLPFSSYVYVCWVKL